MKVVLAISGYAQAGKDSFADALEKQVASRYIVSRHKFAEPLRRAIQHSFDYLGIKVSPWTEDKAEKDALRPLLCELGEYSREQDINIFAKITADEIAKDLDRDGQIAVVTDMRYYNEDNILRCLCKARGWSYHRIHIHRQGNPPANPNEQRSVSVLLEMGSTDAVYSAASGDMGRIAFCAKDYIQTMLLPLVHHQQE